MDNSDLVFLDSTHSYFLKGKELLSVTTVLDRAGITDFEKVPIDLLERARIFGEYSHKVCELDDKGILDESSVDPQLLPYLEGWRKFKAEKVSEILHIEIPVYSKLGYAGTLDRIYRDKNGDLCLGDIKSCTTLEAAAVALQTAAYSYAFEKLYKMKIRHRVGIQLIGGNEYHSETYKKRTDFDYFMAALKVVQYKVENKIRT